MKNPKSNYIIDAVRIRRKRRIIRGVVACAAVILVSFVIFFIYILNLKEDIDESFDDEPVVTPSAYSFASTEETDTSDSSGSDTSSGTVPSDDPTTEAQTSASDENESQMSSGEDTMEDSTSDTLAPDDTNETTETTPNLQPDETMHHEPVLFPQKYPLQTVTHAERDQAYASLKQSVKKYIADHDTARIGFHYINLSTSESFGYNDVAPFVVGSCIHVPLAKMFCDDIKDRRATIDRLFTYSKQESDSEILSKVAASPEGKQFYAYQLLDYSLKYGDGVAMNMLIESMGGMEGVLSRLKTETKGVDFSALQRYEDYKKIPQAGAHRSSAYDLANYAEALYWSYISYPESYQPIIDSMAGCDSNWGVGNQFPSGTTILHRTGSNTTFHSECDVAIILSTEPVVVSVTVEAETPEECKEIQSALGVLVYNFLSYCHT